MNVVIPFCLSDTERVRQLLDWIQWLGWPEQARLFMMASLKCQDPALLPSGAQWITDYSCIESSWKKDTKDASGPNSLWQQTAKHFRREQLGEWLWLEPDSMPCHRDWHHALTVGWSEAQQRGKNFLGADVPAYGNREHRMSGVAVYAQETPVIMAHTAMMCREQAFDSGGAPHFLEHAHLTNLIVNEWRGIPFQSQEDLDSRVPAGTAIFHGCGDGSIYRFLKNRVLGVSAPLTPALDGFLGSLATVTAACAPQVLERAANDPCLKSAFAILTTECAKGSLNKARVVAQLTKLGIITAEPKPKPKQRRKKRALRKVAAAV